MGNTEVATGRGSIEGVCIVVELSGTLFGNDEDDDDVVVVVEEEAEAEAEEEAEVDDFVSLTLLSL